MASPPRNDDIDKQPPSKAEIEARICQELAPPGASSTLDGLRDQLYPDGAVDARVFSEVYHRITFPDLQTGRDILRAADDLLYLDLKNRLLGLPSGTKFEDLIADGLFENRVCSQELFEGVLRRVAYKHPEDGLWYSRFYRSCSHNPARNCECPERWLSDDECKGSEARRMATRRRMQLLSTFGSSDSLIVGMAEVPEDGASAGEVADTSFVSTSSTVVDDDMYAGCELRDTTDNGSAPSLFAGPSVAGPSATGPAAAAPPFRHSPRHSPPAESSVAGPSNTTPATTGPPTTGSAAAAPPVRRSPRHSSRRSASTESSSSSSSSVSSTDTPGPDANGLGPIGIFATVETVPIPPRSPPAAGSPGTRKRKRRVTDEEEGESSSGDSAGSEPPAKKKRTVRFDTGSARDETSSLSSLSTMSSPSSSSSSSPSSDDDEVPAAPVRVQCLGTTKKGNRCGFRKTLPAGQNSWNCGRHTS